MILVTTKRLLSSQCWKNVTASAYCAEGDAIISVQLVWGHTLQRIVCYGIWKDVDDSSTNLRLTPSWSGPIGLSQYHHECFWLVGSTWDWTQSFLRSWGRCELLTTLIKGATSNCMTFRCKGRLSEHLYHLTKLHDEFTASQYQSELNNRLESSEE